MKPSGRRAQSRQASIELVVDGPEWREVDSLLKPRLRRAARLALAHARGKGSLAILLSGDEALRRLNREFRGLDKPTDVLSFPAPPNPEAYLGDIAIAYGMTAREARKAGKNFADHAAHLAVHGVLHLLGYDHATASGAEIMEPLETEILAELGIADPYARAVA